MINTLAIGGKVISESLLSLYPVFVKNIGLNINIQLWTRLIIYFIISLFLCNFTFIKEHLFSFMGLLLGITNLIHIYSSYKGFQLLESGIAYTLFYTYPIIILLLSGKRFHWSIILAFIGTILLLSEQLKDNKSQKIQTPKGSKALLERSDNDKELEVKEEFKYEGFVMILIAALTEAFIYFQVRNIPTKNNWNHLFIAYFIGALFMSIYIFFYYKEENKDYINNNNNINNSLEAFENNNNNNKSIFDLIKNKEKLNRIGIALLINGVIGSIGYFLRFYAATRLEPLVYASLSYIGIFMSFVYGIIFNKESFTSIKLIGSILIFISYYFMKKYI